MVWYAANPGLVLIGFEQPGPDVLTYVCMVFSLSDEIVDSSDEEESDGNYTFCSRKKLFK